VNVGVILTKTLTLVTPGLETTATGRDAKMIVIIEVNVMGILVYVFVNRIMLVILVTLNYAQMIVMGRVYAKTAIVRVFLDLLVLQIV